MVRFEVLHFKFVMREKLFKVHVKHEFYKKAWCGEILSFPFKFVTREKLFKVKVKHEL